MWCSDLQLIVCVLVLGFKMVQVCLAVTATALPHHASSRRRDIMAMMCAN